MLQQINEMLKKNKQNIRIGLFLLAFSMGIILFWTSYHNLDLLQNYSIIYSTINLEHFCSDDALDIKDITDCTAVNYCPDFKTIYLYSKYLGFVSHILLVTIIVEILITKWKNISQ